MCGREKCALKRKPYPPGIHGKAFRRASSEFGTQLRDKQRIRFLYNIREKQFKNYVLAALKQKTVRAPDALLSSLERRLDNVVFRLGFAVTRSQARQIVNHGHVWVGARRVNIPSYQVKVGDEIRIRSQSVQKALFRNLDIQLKKYNPPTWLVLDKDSKMGKVIARPTQDMLDSVGKGMSLSSIVEYYSR